MAANMMGPVIRALMQHLATENAAADQEIARFASAGVTAMADLAHGQWADADEAAGGRGPRELGTDETGGGGGAARNDSLPLLSDDPSSIPTPVLGFTAREHAVAPVTADADDRDGGDQVGDAGFADAPAVRRRNVMDPPDVDDDFKLPPPAIDISTDFGELFPLGIAAHIRGGIRVAAGTTRGQPPAIGADMVGAQIIPGAHGDDLAEVLHGGRNSQPSTPRTAAGDDVQSDLVLKGEDSHSDVVSSDWLPVAATESDLILKEDDFRSEAVSSDGLPVAAPETPRPGDEDSLKGEVATPQRVIGERALQLVADLEVFRIHELLKGMWELWADFARTMRLKHRLEVAAAFGVALGPPPQPTTQRHCPPHVVVHVRPTGVSRVPVGCCQAVRVGRRRVAAQRAPRPALGVSGARRCAPCGGATAPRR